MISGSRCAGLVFFHLWLGVASFSQLPPSQKLSGDDLKGFTQELNRLARMLKSASDKCSVEFEIARTYAAGGQYRESVEWLQKVIDLHAGFDPSRDQLFAPKAGAKEFKTLVETARADTFAVSRSYPVTTIPENELFPENMAYDARAKTFYIGGTSKRQIVRCNARGRCEPFILPNQDGLGDVLGLKIDRRSETLWTTSNSREGAGLRQYDLGSGQLMASYQLAGAHLFNDLVVSSQGDVFVTDTKEGSVYRLRNETSKLQRVAPQHAFTAANGIALSSDETKLFVSNFGDGITIVDRASQATAAMAHSTDVCLGYIDGLYARRGSLIAIQNGPMSPRIVRFSLTSNEREIKAVTVLA